MFTKWLPWKYVVRRVARAKGFVDPISVLARLHSFAEPSEVTAPAELLRAGVVFHARGLMNANAIQHNRDWIWPYWVERQFDPKDEAFVPRAFSITHVNLTHRNWTAVGIPGSEHLPIVDPRGLLTPFWDGWSIDGWIFQMEGGKLVPSRERVVGQQLQMDDGLQLTTECSHGSMGLSSTVEVVRDDQGAEAVEQRWQAKSGEAAWLLLSVRPYNPEGVSFVHDIELAANADAWKIGDHGHVRFSQPADHHFTSDYKHGDVSALVWSEGAKSVHCPVGMATAAAAFKLEPGEPREITLSVPLDGQAVQHWAGSRTPNAAVTSGEAANDSQHACAAKAWARELEGTTRLDVPVERFRALHDAALRTVALHTPGEVYSGPYTYKRFWVRDAACILNAAMCHGLQQRVVDAIPHLLECQDRTGYFHSQEAEWDANGEALWLLERHLQFTNRNLPPVWQSVVRQAADWICKKLVPADSGSPAAGLMPAGFSAEYLGPSDFYYWDDFWSIAGLKTASRLLEGRGESAVAERYGAVANQIAGSIQRSLESTDYMRSMLAYPAAPERRMDAGAIGSLAASYPLQLVEPGDERLQGTLEFLVKNCMMDGGFFQDMIHSGINPFLTLQIAQAMLRNGDSRSFELINVVAKLASETGQWPQAIHPRTMGGCMGDGQHVTTAAAWLMAVRNLFVREEANSLVIGSGIPPHWHYSKERMAYGPTWTPWGKLSVAFKFDVETADLTWDADWHAGPPPVRVAIPCFHEVELDMAGASGKVTVESNHTCKRELV